MPAPWHFSRTPWALTGAGLLLAALAWGGATTWRSAQVPTPALVADMEADFCVVAPPTPYDPALGLALTAARAVPVGARCPVCGMYPARSPDWAAQVIFANGDAQLKTAQASRAALEKTKPFKEPIVTEIVLASAFYPAEDYHQDYYTKNPIRYKYYRTSCGRDARLQQLWGDLAGR